jgi:hypothetical protein
MLFTHRLDINTEDCREKANGVVQDWTFSEAGPCAHEFILAGLQLLRSFCEQRMKIEAPAG